jgi:hypothetical protein
VLAGMAAVHLLSPDATDAWNRELPEHLRVWGGAVRLYLPDIDVTSDEDGVRHRWFPPPMFDRHPRRAGLMLARRISLAGRWVDPPAAWSRLRTLVTRPDDAELAGLVTTARESLPSVTDVEVDQLRAEVEFLLEQAVLLEQARADERAEAEREAARLTAVNKELEDQLLDGVEQQEELARERAALLVALRHVPANDREPAEDALIAQESLAPSTTSEAVELARLHLQFLAIPDGACRDIDRLDESLKYNVWALTTWQGLRALDAYARQVSTQGNQDGFYEWCRRSAQWPISKLAMVEGEATMANDRLRAMRLVPVDIAVAVQGRIEMQAHLKIQPGGGNNIPRVYFHDDTAGLTGKIHVGFIGPHYLMPNTKAN